MKRIVGLLLFTLLTACGPRTIPLVIHVPTGITARTEALEVYVVDTCASAPVAPPAGARAMASWRRGEPTQPLSGTLPARFGVLVLARGSDCAVVGARCVMATEDDAQVVVDLLATTGPACASCDAGLCGGATDAAVVVDAGSDASSDASFDAAPDARAVTAETRCDCLDDDTDAVVDEGCAGTGGDVLWQSTFDGPGDQNLRSLVHGRDGRLYTNGWMSGAPLPADRATLSCNGRTLEAVGNEVTDFSRTWTLGLNANTGACETVLERDTVTAPFASVWPAHRGVWMFVSDALVRIEGDEEQERIALMPGDRYNAGHVRLSPTDPTHIVFSYRTTDAVPSMAVESAGMQSITNVGGTLVAVASGTNVTGIGTLGILSTAAFVDDTHIVTIGANVLPVASPCEAVMGASRVQVRLVANPNGCERVFGTDFPTAGAEIQATVMGDTLWVIRTNDVSVLALNVVTGASHTLDLPDFTGELSPSVMLAAAPDGTLFVGIASNGMRATPGGDTTAGGYILRLRDGATGITSLGERRFPGPVIGLDVGPDGTVYVMSTVDAEATLCAREGSFVPMGSGRLITALDFGL